MAQGASEGSTDRQSVPGEVLPGEAADPFAFVVPLPDWVMQYLEARDAATARAHE